MKRIVSLTLALVLVSMLGMAEGSKSKAGSDKKAESIDLFNGKNLDDWEIFVKKEEGQEAVDPKEIWKVEDGVIVCKGLPFGYLRTKKTYSDFKLTLEWKWPAEPTNSGVLVRMKKMEEMFPPCIEAQLKHTRAGDVVGMDTDFNENTRPKGDFFRVASREQESSEKEPGEWNTYEILCKGDIMILKVNGKLQNAATGITLKSGHIGLQSEGSPIMFRNIKLTPIK